MLYNTTVPNRTAKHMNVHSGKYWKKVSKAWRHADGSVGTSGIRGSGILAFWRLRYIRRDLTFRESQASVNNLLNNAQSLVDAAGQGAKEK